MNFVVLMGSPRKNGNTAELCKPFIAELERRGVAVKYIPLDGLKISPCRACYACQNVSGEYGCVQKDDMHAIASAILWADCIVLATPIFSWYCTAPMKAVLDRHYGFNKYYGTAEGSLWAGRKLALLLTHGYPAEDATGPFVEGVQRLCAHSGLEYAGMFSVRDENDLASFRTESAARGAEVFARQLLNERKPAAT